MKAEFALVCCTLLIFVAFPLPTKSSCSELTKLIVPLYEDPDSNWNKVAAGASSVTTIAIINPNSGPGSGESGLYNGATGIPVLTNAGITVVGYVHTSNGGRSITTVQNDVLNYYDNFDGLSGIFVDEVSGESGQYSYYSQLSAYIYDRYDLVIFNPGTVPDDTSYYGLADITVTFEDDCSDFPEDEPSGATCSNRDDYAAIGNSCSSSEYPGFLSAVKSYGYYGWAFATEDYDTLTSYYAAEVTNLA